MIPFSRLLTATFLMGLWAFPNGVAACPNPDAPAATLLRETGVGLRWGTSARVLAGGTDPLASCAQFDAAWNTTAGFSVAPTMQLNLAGMIGLGIELRAVRGCAREFLIQTADGTWYHRGPGLTGMVPPVVVSRVGNGPLRLWVGTAPGDTCRMRIEISTVAG